MSLASLVSEIARATPHGLNKLGASFAGFKPVLENKGAVVAFGQFCTKAGETSAIVAGLPAFLGALAHLGTRSFGPLCEHNVYHGPQRTYDNEGVLPYKRSGVRGLDPAAYPTITSRPNHINRHSGAGQSWSPERITHAHG